MVLMTLKAIPVNLIENKQGKIMILLPLTTEKLYSNEHIIKHNLTEILNKATLQGIPDNWYVEQKKYIKVFFSEFDFITICGVISALSPRMNWLYNLQSARHLIAHYRLGSDIATMQKYTRQTSRNIDKAIAILESVSSYEIYDILNSRKTQNFFMNLVDPECEDYVTLDYHMIKACQLIGKQSLTVKQYDFIAQIIKDIAEIKGLLPNHVQSIIWEFVR